MACVPLFENLALDPAFSDIRLDEIVNLEAKRLHDTLHDASLQGFLVEVPSDKDEATLASFVLLPADLLFKTASEEHVDALEHELLLHTLDGKHALVAEEIRSF